jgi:hypothetical protein
MRVCAGLTNPCSWIPDQVRDDGQEIGFETVRGQAPVSGTYRRGFGPALIDDRVSTPGVDLPGLARPRPFGFAAHGQNHPPLRGQSELVAARPDPVDAIGMRRQAAAGRHPADPAIVQPSPIAMLGRQDEKHPVDQAPDFRQLGLELPFPGTGEKLDVAHLLMVDADPVIVRLARQRGQSRHDVEPLGNLDEIVFQQLGHGSANPAAGPAQ